MDNPKLYDIQLRAGNAHRGPRGQNIKKGQTIRLPEADAAYYLKQPKRFNCREVDPVADSNKAERLAAPVMPGRRRRKASPADTKPPAAPQTELDKMSRSQLKDRADELGLTVRSGDTKADLKARILTSEAQAAEDGDEPGSDSENEDGSDTQTE